MNQFILAFITGITTGGLSCLAVQGGLLASSLAHQLEQDILKQASVKKSKRNPRPQLAFPIALFLLAKLTAYTLLGLLLGWLGSLLTLSSTIRAVLLIAIGIFMIGNALRMFNVHPIFRYFTIEPPKFITRYIRRTSKNTDLITPLFLGALTVFIPCGVTQAMMAVALATGDPIQGAALMFAFTLGTSPVFFLVAYLTMQLGARMEKWFARFVAVVMLGLGLISMNNGLSLMGSPLSFSSLRRNLEPPRATEAVSQTLDGQLMLTAANNGYFPKTLYAKAGEATQMAIVTNKTFSCSRDFVIPALRYEVLLPESGTVTVDIPAQPAGTVMRFSCSMGMYTGEIVFGD